jgi:hypothetical protein
MDNLKPGDVILFNRRWYDYHIHRAVFIKLYQFCYDTDFDHCGIFMLDRQGTPYILEQRPFGQPRLVPFAEKILNSRAHLIVALPLLPRRDLQPSALQKLQSYAEKLTTNGKSMPENQGILNGSIAMVLKRFQAITGIRTLGTTLNGFICPNMSMIASTWHAMDITILNEDKFHITCKELVDSPQDILLARTSENDKRQQASKQRSSSVSLSRPNGTVGNHVLLRTR